VHATKHNLLKTSLTKTLFRLSSFSGRPSWHVAASSSWRRQLQRALAKRDCEKRSATWSPGGSGPPGLQSFSGSPLRARLLFRRCGPQSQAMERAILMEPEASWANKLGLSLLIEWNLGREPANFSCMFFPPAVHESESRIHVAKKRDEFT
jgi:hypothetical protein